jgi:hypothetical protein
VSRQAAEYLGLGSFEELALPLKGGLDECPCVATKTNNNMITYI